jgi:hypothetical protein
MQCEREKFAPPPKVEEAKEDISEKSFAIFLTGDLAVCREIEEREKRRAATNLLRGSRKHQRISPSHKRKMFACCVTHCRSTLNPISSIHSLTSTSFINFFFLLSLRWCSNVHSQSLYARKEEEKQRNFSFVCKHLFSFFFCSILQTFLSLLISSCVARCRNSSRS